MLLFLDRNMTVCFTPHLSNLIKRMERLLTNFLPRVGNHCLALGLLTRANGYAAALVEVLVYVYIHQVF